MDKEGKMDNSVKITMIVVVGFLVLAGIVAGVYFSTLDAVTGDERTIQGNGIAEIKVLPDEVTVYFNVETRALTSKEAGEDNSEMTDELITAIIKEGFERSDIVTENYNIYPEYDWSESKGQTLKGYVATHSVKVKMSSEDYDKIGDVVDAGVNAGALISYINFELSQTLQNTYKAQALEDATKDAKVKAEAVARGLGKSLGDIIRVESSDFDYYPWPVFRAGAESGSADAAMVKEATTSITPGEQSVSARVTVVYELE